MAVSFSLVVHTPPLPLFFNCRLAPSPATSLLHPHKPINSTTSAHSFIRCCIPIIWSDFAIRGPPIFLSRNSDFAECPSVSIDQSLVSLTCLISRIRLNDFKNDHRGGRASFALY